MKISPVVYIIPQGNRQGETRSTKWFCGVLADILPSTYIPSHLYLLVSPKRERASCWFLRGVGSGKKWKSHLVHHFILQMDKLRLRKVKILQIVSDSAGIQTQVSKLQIQCPWGETAANQPTKQSLSQQTFIKHLFSTRYYAICMLEIQRQKSKIIPSLKEPIHQWKRQHVHIQIQIWFICIYQQVQRNFKGEGTSSCGWETRHLLWKEGYELRLEGKSSEARKKRTWGTRVCQCKGRVGDAARSQHG